MLGEQTPLKISKDVLRVLLVEDDDVDARIVTFYSGLMETYEFDLTRARNIGDARRLIEEVYFDACLLDYWVGQEDSLKILTVLEKKLPKIPTVVLSNISTRDVDKFRLQSGGAYFLAKGSCTAKSLEYAMHKVLQPAA